MNPNPDPPPCAKLVEQPRVRCLLAKLPCTIQGLLDTGTAGVLHGRAAGAVRELTLACAHLPFNGVSMSGELSVGWAGSASAGWSVESGFLSGRGQLDFCSGLMATSICPLISGSVTLRREAQFGPVTRASIRVKLRC